MDDLLQEFIGETRETLEAISGEIVGWEADPSDRTRLDAIFRFVHTIKGSCGFLDLPRLARLSHAAEDVLSDVRAGERLPDARLVSAILAIIDRIGNIVEAIDSGDGLDDSGEDALIAALEPDATRRPIARDDGAGSPLSAAAAGTGTRAAKRSVRLSVDLLDRMMGGVSDMVLARNQMARHIRALDDPRLDALLERLSVSVGELRDTVTRTRMQRIEALFAPLPRMVRDTAAALGKSVTLTLEGTDVELDREMIELLRDPLIHMVRNSIDHGIEARADRVLAGKPAAGALRVGARQAGNVIVVEIVDDGQGIDVDRIAAKAAALDPARAGAIGRMSVAERLDLIFEPGLSVRDTATDVSGRGVGMDVVKANVEQIGGRIMLSSRRGHGLAVTIEVPLTLAILNTVIVEAAGTRFAFPRQAVEEIIPFDPGRVTRFANGSMVTARDRRLPLVPIEELVGADPAPAAYLALLQVRHGTIAVPIGAVCDMQELVVKPASAAVMRAGIYAGQMLPDDGIPVLLIDVAAMAARAGIAFEAPRHVHKEDVREQGARMLLIEALDGLPRLLPAEAVARVEQVPAGAIRRADGAWWLTRDDATVRVVDLGPDTAGSPMVVRITLDAVEFAYPVRDVSEIVELPVGTGADSDNGAVVTIAGEPIAVLDLLGLVDEAVVTAARPICLLDGAERSWMEAFLRPTIEAAGYRVVRVLAPGETAAVALAMEDDEVAATGASGRNVIRLARRPGAGVYRLDRGALIAALTERRA